ncbi:hypothetical protein ABBQ38_011028 [Trebouxia sp. C0009 RCD-2024]
MYCMSCLSLRLTASFKTVCKATSMYTGPKMIASAAESAIVHADAYGDARSRRLTDAMMLIGSPSYYANQIVKQADLATGKVFNCYRSEQRPVPLALCYPFFADFCSRMSSTASLMTRDLLFIKDLCQAMQGFASAEKQRELSFGKLFRQYLQGMLSPTVELKHQTRGQSIVDIRLQAEISDQVVTLVHVEVKREAGQSGDAQQEGMAYHLKDHAAEAFMMTWQTLKPALLITVVGPSVRAFGLCVDGNSTGICEPLSPAMDMLLIPHMPDSFASLATFFSSMPQLVQDLRDHYEQAAAETRKLQFLGRKQEQLPFPLWDPDVWTDAYQLGPATTHKLVYLATSTASPQQQYVVKFTQRYGIEAHQAWATAGIVPKLLEHRQLAGMWQQVVMEYLPPQLPDASGWLTMRYLMQPVAEQLKAAPKQLVLAPEMIAHLIQRAEQLLCDAHALPVSGLPAAHGDARPDNIMVCVRGGEVLRLKLIDMDWAGAAGRVVYPALINTKNIVWPDGVAPGKVLEQKHDIELLHLQGNRATQFVVNDWKLMFATSVQVSEMDVD